MAPAGQLWSTATDLARFASFLLGDTGGVLSPDTLEEMTVPAGVDPSPAVVVRVRARGAGRRVGGVTLVGHGGSMPGFLAGIWVDRERGDRRVRAGQHHGRADGGLPAAMLADLRAAEPRIVAPWTPEPPPVDPSLLGPWYWGPVAVRAARGPRRAAAPRRSRRPGRPVAFPARAGRDVGRTGRLFRRRDAAARAGRVEPGTFVFTRTPYDPAAPVPGGVDERRWH